MEREKFEAAFLEFIEGEAHREAAGAVLSIARAAFSAGWCAARYPADATDETDPPR